MIGSPYPGADVPLLDPVVEAAMTELGQVVNHANALVGVYDKEHAVSTLQALFRSGYRRDADKLCAWHSRMSSQTPKSATFGTTPR